MATIKYKSDIQVHGPIIVNRAGKSTWKYSICWNVKPKGFPKFVNVGKVHNWYFTDKKTSKSHYSESQVHNQILQQNPVTVDERLIE